MNWLAKTFDKLASAISWRGIATTCLVVVVGLASVAVFGTRAEALMCFMAAGIGIAGAVLVAAVALLLSLTVTPIPQQDSSVKFQRLTAREKREVKEGVEAR